MKAVKVAIQLALLSLAMATAPLTTFASEPEAPVNTFTSVLSNANLTLETHATPFNSSKFAVTEFLSSAYAAAAANLVLNVAAELENATISVPQYDLSNVTTDEVIELISLKLSEVAYASASLVAQSTAADNVIASMDTDIQLQISELIASTSSSGSRDSLGALQQVPESPGAVEIEILNQAPSQVVSHSLQQAIVRSFSAIEEAARAASQQFESVPSTEATKIVTESASAPASESAAASAESALVRIHTLAAVSAVAVIVVMALFGYQRRQQRDYDALSSGSATLAALTPPQALNV